MHASVAYCEEAFVNLGEYAGFGRSFFVSNGAFFSVHARCTSTTTDQNAAGQKTAGERAPDPANPGEQTASSASESVIILTRYVETPDGLRPGGQESLMSGTKPSVISDGQSAFALAIGQLPDQMDADVLWILDLSTRHKTFCHLSPDAALGDGVSGVNSSSAAWQPFLKRGQLFAWQGCTPAHEIALGKGGQIGPIGDVETAPARLDVPASAIVSGLNGIIGDDDGLYGFRSGWRGQVRRAPFAWRLSPKGSLTQGAELAFDAFVEHGYNFHDVTSYFQHSGHSYLGLTLAERDKGHSQRMADVLLRVTSTDSLMLFRDPSVWARFRREDLSLKTAHTIFPAEQDSDCARRDTQGSVTSLGQAGFVTMTSKLPVGSDDGRQILEVYYRCHEGRTEDIGFVRVMQYQQKKLARPSLYAHLSGTEGDIAVEEIELPELTDDIECKMLVCTSGPILEVLNIRIRPAATGAQPLADAELDEPLEACETDETDRDANATAACEQT